MGVRNEANYQQIHGRTTHVSEFALCVLAYFLTFLRIDTNNFVVKTKFQTFFGQQKNKRSNAPRLHQPGTDHTLKIQRERKGLLFHTRAETTHQMLPHLCSENSATEAIRRSYTILFKIHKNQHVCELYRT